jgi:hypothetical protein
MPSFARGTDGGGTQEGLGLQVLVCLAKRKELLKGEEVCLIGCSLSKLCLTF